MCLQKVIQSAHAYSVGMRCLDLKPASLQETTVNVYRLGDPIVNSMLILLNTWGENVEIKGRVDNKI